MKGTVVAGYVSNVALAILVINALSFVKNNVSHVLSFFMLLVLLIMSIYIYNIVKSDYDNIVAANPGVDLSKAAPDAYQELMDLFNQGIFSIMLFSVLVIFSFSRIFMTNVARNNRYIGQ
jgi:hypothetical protein